MSISGINAILDWTDARRRNYCVQADIRRSIRLGALLLLGDGHALQGDGELPGQGLETSLDVTFRVDVIAGRSLGQPRVESADAMMVMGTGGSLDAAMQSATTQMSCWLQDT